MAPETALTLIIRPTLAFMGARYNTREAQRMLLAIGLQESGFTHRVQVGGPAHGYWQFERGGGVAGVLTHRASRNLAAKLCRELDHAPTAEAVYAALPNDAVLACLFARLLLYTDSAPLPTRQADGWKYYLRTWRPGTPHPETWGAHWQRAEDTLRAAEI